MCFSPLAAGGRRLRAAAGRGRQERLSRAAASTPPQPAPRPAASGKRPPSPPPRRASSPTRRPWPPKTALGAGQGATREAPGQGPVAAPDPGTMVGGVDSPQGLQVRQGGRTNEHTHTKKKKKKNLFSQHTHFKKNKDTTMKNKNKTETTHAHTHMYSYFTSNTHTTHPHTRTLFIYEGNR